METKVDSEPTVLDTVKLAFAAAIAVGGVAGWYYYPQYPAPVRAVGVIIAFILAALVALQSAQGQALWKFIQSSRIEMRKVVWPTREETVQTTVAVLIFATIMGVFFWLLDLFLLWFTRLVTGQGA